jgi:SAM-dependent methyltransferase
MNRLWSDTHRITHAIASNLLAGIAPGLYVRLTQQTGRGAGEEQPEDIAGYFLGSFHDYFEKLGIPPEQVPAWLSGKTLLEYGPGDLPGVALLMLAYGAAKVWCVDRFPLVRLSEKNILVLRDLLDRLPDEQRLRAGACFKVQNDPASGFKAERIEYLVRASGLSGLAKAADLVYSRAVLEHVNDLAATYTDMHRALKPQGISIHLVDLKSHGLHRANPLDFLTWPAWLWNLMYGFKGVPNRWRKIHHLQAADTAGLKISTVEVTTQASPSDVSQVRPFLSKSFRRLDDTELAALGFWLVCSSIGPINSV